MYIAINNSSGIPIYAQIEKQIKNNIEENKLDANEPLPSIRVLAKELRISVITVKKAYENLERDEYIYTIPGKGSFVSKQDMKKIRENIISETKENFKMGILEGKKINLSLEDMKKILEELY